MSKLKEKPALASLKAAMVLAFPATAVEDRVVTWWKGVAKDMAGNDVVVMQVSIGDPKFVPHASKILSGYGIPVSKIVEGSGSTLMALPASSIGGVLPKRVTHHVDNDGGAHYEWKCKVVKQLDALGIDRLVMRYSGGGDSTNDDEWECYRSGVEGGWYPQDWNADASRHWRAQDDIKLPNDLCQMISEYVWNTLCQFDCVNNDGGGGHLEIKLEDETYVFLFTCFTNEMVSTTHQDDEEV